MFLAQLKPRAGCFLSKANCVTALCRPQGCFCFCPGAGHSCRHSWGVGAWLCHTSKPKCAAPCTATHTRLWAPNLPFLTSCDGAGDQQKVIGWKKGHWQVLDHHTDFSELFKAQSTLWPSGLQGESNGLFQLCHSALPGHFSWAGRGTVPLLKKRSSS